MLKLKYMFENFALAKRALMLWEHNEESRDKYFKYFRISSNAIYPFEGGGKRCFLRLAPVEEKQECNLKGELEYLMYLQKKGYPSLVPLASKEGNLLEILDTEWGRYYASVFEGVPGKPIEAMLETKTDITDYEVMSSYGKTLGRLHRLSMEYEPVCKRWSYREALDWIRDVLEEYHAPMTMRKEADSVEDELSKLPINKDTFGLVHYDFEPDNVFYDSENRKCHVIDFEDGMYHFYLLDIEQVLEALSEELHGEAFARAKEAFVQGYRSEKILVSDYEKDLPLMRRFCDIYAYARLIRCVAEEVEEAPEWMIHLRDVLQSKIKALENHILKVQCKSEEA